MVFLLADSDSDSLLGCLVGWLAGWKHWLVLTAKTHKVKLDLCEGGSFSPTIFKSEIELSVYHSSCFISVCPFVTLLTAKLAENLHILLSGPYSKVFIFNLLCVLICSLGLASTGSNGVDWGFSFGA